MSVIVFRLYIVEFSGGTDTAGAVQGFHRQVYRRPDGGRSEGIFREVRRGDRRVYTEAVQGVQFRHVFGPRSGAEFVRRGPYYKR